jgi:hypothetical protein
LESSKTMSKKTTYPFKAKSTAYLQPGQFWAIDLTRHGYAFKGRYGCGRVLELDGNKQLFLAGLMNWVGTKLPTSESIAGCTLLEQSVSHVHRIDGDILGCRSLETDNLEPLLWLDDYDDNPHTRPKLMRGLVVLREATKAEVKTLEKKDLVMRWGDLNGYSLKPLVSKKKRK